MRKFVAKFTRQIIAATLLVSLITPQVANAQLVVSAPLLEGQTILSYIQTLLKVVFKNVAVVGAVNVSQQIARDAAESIASWVVEGAPGQNPLVYMKSPGDYVKDHTKKALGDVLDQMSEDFANASLLCISDPAAPLGVLAGLYGALNAKANIPPFNNKGKNIEGISTGTLGKCDAGSIALSYKSLTNELSSEQLLSRFSGALGSGGTEIDAVIDSQFQALTSIIREQKMAEYERLATKSHQDLKSPISGEVRQPAAQVAEDASLNSAKFQMEQEAEAMSGILASGAEAIPAIFATTLANSLSKKLITRLKQGKGTVNPAKKDVNLANIFGAGKTLGNGPGAIYSSIKTAVISEGELDLLTTFTACPDKFAQQDNCVLDSSFAAAIRASDAGKTLTVKDALDQGKLHGEWELVPPSKTALNEDRLCYKSAYCFSNLAKLRKARIIPIGWEIAAGSADGTGKVTLGEAVKGFSSCSYTCSNDPAKTCSTDTDCGAGNTCNATRDKAHPYCHLIDPNWVLKMPELVCRAKVFGAVPESQLSSNRQEQCADQASCLAEDSNGQCTGSYGYCLRERNTFRFDAESCPAQFAGCRLFNNKQFGQIGLVESTLSSAACSDKNTGCLGYNVAFKPTGGYDETQQKVFLNSKAEQCDAKYAGCTEVQNATTGQTQNLRLAPPTLGCKGLSSDPSECSQYAQSCTVDEVGCEVYQPVGSTDQAIPGIATFATKNANGQILEWNDECSSQCVGYSSYYQAPTQTEPINPTPVAFIPKSAKVCTQDVVGCDAYVNIDSAAKGGGSTAYYSSLQKCSDPAVNSNHAVFYSWEGSDQAGYQLRQHDLTLYTENKFSVFTSGSPFYDVTDTELATLNAQCNEQVYKERVKDGKPNPAFNSDCRELFDAQGKAAYRLISKTLVSSASCTVYRKEKADQQNCEASRGTFNAGTGSCEYGILAAGSTSCKAEFVGCRAYNGAASLSPKSILNESFSIASGWNGGELSSEGITVGDTVLKVSGSSTDHEIAINIGKTYSMVLWAKGNGSFNVKFKSGVYTTNDVTLNSDPLVLTPDWRRFEVSTAVAPWTDAKAKLVFEKTAGTSLMYLENIVIKEQADVVYVIKDSWVTPAMCDPNPTDKIPGPALNCRQYKPKSDSKKAAVYLTGFTGLCREASAGCAKFVTTQNTKEVTEREVNFGTDAKPLIHKIPADDLVYAVANSAAFCPADKKGCSALGLNVNGKTETVFRINNPENYTLTSCKQTEEWCETFSTTDGQQRYFKYPDKNQRCEYHEKKEVSGVEYSGWFKEGTDQPCDSGFVSGGNTYGIYKNQDANYKGMTASCDPEFNQCTEFIDRADISKENPSGRPYFFMKNAGLDTASCNGKVSLKDGCVVLDDTSNGEKSIATLLTYCKSDPTTQKYCDAILTFAGVPADQRMKDGALVAPSLGPADYNSGEQKVTCERLAASGVLTATDCDSRVVRLQKFYTEQAVKFDPALLNCATESGKKLVNTIVETGRAICAVTGNANTIVKVKRDRTCAEWLACQSSISVYDKSTQKYKEVCTDVGVCRALSKDSGAVGQCASWVTPEQTKTEGGTRESLPLSTNLYTARNVGWYGLEYSGFSLWKKFQPNNLSWFVPDVTDKNSKNILGAGFTSERCFTEPEGAACTADAFVVGGKDQGNVSVLPSIKAEFTDTNNFSGVCYQRKCWYPLTGFQKEPVKTEQFTALSCKGYPEADAPFPVSIAQQEKFGAQVHRDPLFKQVNVCERYKSVLFSSGSQSWTSFESFKNISGYAPKATEFTEGCECSYTKVAYGQFDEKKYYPVSAEPAKGVCSGGWYVEGNKEKALQDSSKVYSKKGLACNSSMDCIDERIVSVKIKGDLAGSDIVDNFTFSSDDGQCMFQTERTKVVGWEGYCLEEDKRTHVNNSFTDRACMTWLPLEVGGTDLYNQYVSAGYDTSQSQGKYYCLESKGLRKSDGTDEFAYTYTPVPDLVPGKPTDGSLNYLVTGVAEKAWYEELAEGIGKLTFGDIAGAVKSFTGNTDNASAYKGYKDYGTVGLPSAFVNPKDVDYIELTATKANVFFPEGYTMKIADDGKARFYINEKMKDVAAAKKDEYGQNPKCPTIMNIPESAAKTDYFDMFDISKSKLKDQMKLISHQVRCGGSGIDAKVCDYFGSTGDPKNSDVDKYFSCSAGEQKTPVGVIHPIADKITGNNYVSLAVTGVARNEGSALLVANQVPLVTQLVFDDMTAEKWNLQNSLGEIWFLRIDNRLGFKNPDKDSYYQEAVGERFLTGDIIRDTTSSGGVINSNASGADCDKVDLANTYGRRAGYTLRFKFKDGQFVGIDAGSCTNRKDHIILAGWTVKVHYRNACTKIARTVGKHGDPSANAAWTNRLWSAPIGGGDSEQLKHDEYQGGIPTPNGGKIGANSKYGSFVTVRAPEAVTYPSGPPPSGALSDPWYGYASGIPKTGLNFTDAIYKADPYSCPTPNNQKTRFCVHKPSGSGAVAATLEEGNAVLKLLFARVYERYDLVNKIGPFYRRQIEVLQNGVEEFKPIIDNTTELGLSSPPVVYAFDSSNCSGARGEQCRMTRKNGFTVNGQYEDGSVIFGKGSVAATVQFYGWADHNHMPLRKIRVNWMDGSTVIDKNGMYRNHKSVCSANDKPAPVCVDASGKVLDPNVTCLSDKDCVSAIGTGGRCQTEKEAKWSFGSLGPTSGNDGACEQGFFQYSHAYSFKNDCKYGYGDASALNLNPNGPTFATPTVINTFNLQGKVGLGERICVYRPKVQLRDNWDICNGVVSSSDFKAKGYGYDKLADVQVCNFKTEAYTPYQGYIVVKE